MWPYIPSFTYSILNPLFPVSCLWPFKKPAINLSIVVEFQARFMETGKALYRSDCVCEHSLRCPLLVFHDFFCFTASSGHARVAEFGSDALWRVFFRFRFPPPTGKYPPRWKSQQFFYPRLQSPLRVPILKMNRSGLLLYPLVGELSERRVLPNFFYETPGGLCVKSIAGLS